MMKTSIATSTCALIVGLYSITPALAESFNDQGLDWAMASPTPTSGYSATPQTLPPDGSFASSWGSGRTPSQALDSSSFSSSKCLTTVESSTSPSTMGYNQRNDFPTC